MVPFKYGNHRNTYHTATASVVDANAPVGNLKASSCRAMAAKLPSACVAGAAAAATAAAAAAADGEPGGTAAPNWASFAKTGAAICCSLASAVPGGHFTTTAVSASATLDPPGPWHADAAAAISPSTPGTSRLVHATHSARSATAAASTTNGG